ncbi:MAG TPA: hypothetical protein VF070_23940 [Streptosporangiaceae bacterium]
MAQRRQPIPDPDVKPGGPSCFAVPRFQAGSGRAALVVASAAPRVPCGIALIKLASPAHVILLWRRDNELPAVRRFLRTAWRVSTERAWLATAAR